MLLRHAFLAALLSNSPLSCQPALPNAPELAHRQEGDGPAPSAQDLPEALSEYPGAPFEDRKGHLWFSTVLRGLVHFDGETFTTFTEKDGLPGEIVRGVVEGTDGKMWIATSGGVSTFDGKSFATVAEYGDLTPHYTFGKTADHLDIWELMFDRKGRLWISTLDGVFRHDGTKFVAFPMPVVGSATASEFTPKFVYSIFEAKDGTLWFGTDGAGVVSYDGESTRVFTAEEHGLCSNRVCTTLQDSRGDFWFGTSDGGVSRYDGKTFRYFTEKDGLSTGGVPSIREDRSGKLWFGTTEGVFVLEGERFVPFTRKG